MFEYGVYFRFFKICIKIKINKYFVKIDSILKLIMMVNIF